MVRSLNLPPAFIDKNGEDPAWLRALPDLIERVAARWSLTVQPHFPAIAWNYVAPATRADGTRCVLKLSRHIEDTRSEIAALRIWDGDGAARLLESDPGLGALLTERIEPGTMLSELAAGGDDAATVIAASVLRRLWRPAPEAHGLFTLERWCEAYDRNRRALLQGEGDFPAALFRRADTMRAELLASTADNAVLHGDMHHANVLRAGHGAWLAIDPKGMAGDRHFDVCQFIRQMPPAGDKNRRLDILCAELGLDRQRAKDWCLVHAVLDACWSFEEGRPLRNKITQAEETLTF